MKSMRRSTDVFQGKRNQAKSEQKVQSVSVHHRDEALEYAENKRLSGMDSGILL